MVHRLLRSYSSPMFSKEEIDGWNNLAKLINSVKRLPPTPMQVAIRKRLDDLIRYEQTRDGPRIVIKPKTGTLSDIGEGNWTLCARENGALMALRDAILLIITTATTEAVKEVHADDAALMEVQKKLPYGHALEVIPYEDKLGTVYVGVVRQGGRIRTMSSYCPTGLEAANMAADALSVAQERAARRGDSPTPGPYSDKRLRRGLAALVGVVATGAGGGEVTGAGGGVGASFLPSLARRTSRVFFTLSR